MIRIAASRPDLGYPLCLPDIGHVGARTIVLSVVAAATQVLLASWLKADEQFNTVVKGSPAVLETS